MQSDKLLRIVRLQHATLRPIVANWQDETIIALENNQIIPELPLGELREYVSTALSLRVLQRDNPGAIQFLSQILLVCDQVLEKKAETPPTTIEWLTTICRIFYLEEPTQVASIAEEYLASLRSEEK